MRLRAPGKKASAAQAGRNLGEQGLSALFSAPRRIAAEAVGAQVMPTQCSTLKELLPDTVGSPNSHTAAGTPSALLGEPWQKQGLCDEN